MPHLIEHKVVRARKDHHCDGCSQLLDFGSTDQIIEEYKLTDTEIISLLGAKKEGFRILKGQTYISQFCRDDGYVYTWKSRPEIYNILVKYKIFEDD